MSTRPSTPAEIFPDPPAGLDPRALDFARVPQHVAIIMDGNGRWAHARGLERAQGHEAGVKAVREVITTCNDIGVRYLTIYSFSTENWKRPATEVNSLMELFAKVMDAEIDGLIDEDVRVVLLGRIRELPFVTRNVFLRAAKRSRNDAGMTLCIAANYGARAEIVDGVRALAKRVVAGELSCEDIDECAIAGSLYTAGMPDPDLCIRTSGEMRLSNFMLWQLAYAEFYVTDVLWPDFDRYEMLRALLSFQRRSRRFGGTR